jgi:hypothetical protein
MAASRDAPCGPDGVRDRSHRYLSIIYAVIATVLSVQLSQYGLRRRRSGCDCLLQASSPIRPRICQEGIRWTASWAKS